MGIFSNLFSEFNRKKDVESEKFLYPDLSPRIPECDAEFYLPDEYYPLASHENTVFECDIIVFPERKKISFPSSRGLYVAEILLLHYCSYGSYPNPAGGYPRFWWFKYGMRNIGFYLSSLEKRGFITKNSNGKYSLTALGQAETQEHEYILYMHKHPRKTTEDSRFGTEFNVWSANRLFRGKPPENWEKILIAAENEIQRQIAARNRLKREKLRKYDPALARRLDLADEQMHTIREAEDRYKADGDTDALIAFYEKIWEQDGVVVNNKGWVFRLSELYISVGEPEKAGDNLNKIQNEKAHVAYYAPIIEKYRQRIETHKIYASSPQTAAEIKTVLTQSTVVQLKSLLASCNIPRTGKKAELIEKIISEIPISKICEFYNISL